MLLSIFAVIIGFALCARLLLGAHDIWQEYRAKKVFKQLIDDPETTESQRKMFKEALAKVEKGDW